MVNNDDVALRFSNTRYATKQEVLEALNIANIDEVWNKILAYRSNFNYALSIRNVEKTPYSITLVPSILDRLNVLERRMTKLMLNYSRLTNDDINKVVVRKNQFIKCLTNVAQKYNLNVTNDFLSSLIEGSVSSMSPSEFILFNYYRALRFVESNFINPIDHNFMINVYSIFTGTSNIDNPYRVEALNNGSFEAPVERIIPMMEELFNFCNQNELSPLIKAIASYYLITYTKPFDVYSEEIAIIFTKNVLAHNDYEEIASLLDFERLLCDEDTLNEIFDNVKNSNDLTYLIDYVIPVVENIVGNLSGQLLMNQAQTIQNEYYERPTQGTRYKESTPLDINAPLSSNAASQVNFEMNVSLPTLPVGLDEKDAAKIEEHLVEVYPTLKRGQAHFYARHCTIGKYYTINQYKTLLRCAYETARTSMDNLVELGFYRKEKLNNKFIYTPVPRRQ